MTQPTDCDLAFFPIRDSEVTADRYSAQFTDEQMTLLVKQYKEGPEIGGMFVPFRLKVRGPSNLRRRSTVYKVEKG